MNQATLPLPHFSAIDIASLKQNVQQLLQQGQQLLNQVQTHKDFAAALACIQQFDDFENQLNEQFGILSHLKAVCDDESVRQAYQEILPSFSSLYAQWGQNENLYQNYQYVANHTDFATLRPSLQSAVQHAIRDFKLSGVALCAEKKAQFAQNAARLSQLSADFSNHVLDATQAYTLPLTEQQLHGFPESHQHLFRQYAEQKGLSGAVATLAIPSYLAVMTYAEDRQLRQTIYHAYTTRASEMSDYPQFDNGAVMQEILQLRQQQAELLGFEHFAAMSLSKKMAPDAQTVQQFLWDLAEKAKAPAQQELAQLQALAAQDGITDLQPWDTPKN